MTAAQQHKILILDFGSQYTQLIARAIRALGVYCELHPFDVDDDFIRSYQAQAIVLSGGPESVTKQGSPRVSNAVFDLGVPILGICYGMQTMAAQLGGAVVAGDHSEFGHADFEFDKDCALFQRMTVGQHPDVIRDSVWMSHGDQVSEMPVGFSVVGKTKSTPIAAIACEAKRFYGLQFHPEVTHTPQGSQILSAFVFDIAKCEASWQPKQIIAESVQQVKATVGQESVLLGLSGGVDSAVVAVLLHQAIPQQLHCVFVDTGLLRLGEVEQVKNTFEDHLGIPLHCVDAKEKFMDALQSVADPEEKRRIIGRLFVECFEEAGQSFPDAKWLAQGTIYPDVIESACAKTNKAHVIKTHHNVGGLPEEMNLKVLEPLRELFKDEVRNIGRLLGLPDQWVDRHPFPGPGLGVRILGEVKPEFVVVLQQADAIFIDELRAHDLYHEVSQAFAVFLPVRSVGVMGDGRTYAPVIALRAVQTVDFMTARWAELPMSFLAHVSNRIVNEVAGVSRVVYDISGKPPATIEWE